jgi:hypothetical protein
MRVGGFFMISSCTVVQVLGMSRCTFLFLNFMFSYLNFIVHDFFQFKLTTLIRVQNLSQTATDFRKKMHLWVVNLN